MNTLLFFHIDSYGSLVVFVQTTKRITVASSLCDSRLMQKPHSTVRKSVNDTRLTPRRATADAQTGIKSRQKAHSQS